MAAQNKSHFLFEDLPENRTYFGPAGHFGDFPKIATNFGPLKTYFGLFWPFIWLIVADLFWPLKLCVYHSDSDWIYSSSPKSVTPKSVTFFEK